MATKKTKRKQKQTLGEFKAWLDGVVELQDENWHPNESQWKRIRDRIYGIIETPPVIMQSVEEQFATPAPAGVQHVIPGIPPSPRPAGGVPSNVPIEMSDSARQLLQETPGGGSKSVTPDSDSNTPSAFA